MWCKRVIQNILSLRFKFKRFPLVLQRDDKEVDLASVEDLGDQWEDAARRADQLAGQVQALVKAGETPPGELLALVAAAEEDVQRKLLDIEAARRAQRT
ncbi:hypothetical protein ASF44_28795 [Pseudorhodoferax sp. Leaf274]|nr:hypothetical protein ASF44_28795 [Pseudorhodoferax sp. Leaf274]